MDFFVAVRKTWNALHTMGHSQKTTKDTKDEGKGVKNLSNPNESASQLAWVHGDCGEIILIHQTQTQKTLSRSRLCGWKYWNRVLVS